MIFSLKFYSTGGASRAMLNMGMGSTSALPSLATLAALAQPSLGVGADRDMEPNPGEGSDHPSNSHGASKSVLSSYWLDRLEPFKLNVYLCCCSII